MSALNVPNVIPRPDQPIVFDPVTVSTTNRTLTTRENGKTIVFDTTTSRRVQLPLPQKGLRFRFFIKQIGAGTGHTIGVSSGVTLKCKVNPTGATIATAAGKGVQNNGAGAGIVGDALEVFSDGINWFGIPTGSWVVEP